MHSEASAAVAVRPETAFTPSQFLLAHVREWQMALQKGLAEGGTSSSTANNNQVLLAIPQRAFECPICLDTIEEETSVSWCRHTFCFPCILEWSRIRPVCPICQEHFQYFFRKVGDNNYEVYYTSSTRCNRGRRDRHHSAERRRHPSAGHRHHRSSSGERGSSRARDWERDRSRSRRRNYDGHSRAQQAQSYDLSSSRRRQHSRAQDTASEPSRDWDQAAGHEWSAQVRLGRSEHRQWAQWDSSRESQATSRRLQRRSHSAWRQTQREEQRRRDHNERHPASPE
ncbi:PREDICTED: PHD and RING finger domain-containing protein 1-like isoform X2 [Ficedula albicollis]|uniref:PHD and RING finger domain-containing protein 1-like isoform X2 n=1 Tax=Ficedula albicollis TaxID=59894 RepID=UPI000359A5E7|nr:PREDICTED: PHD and RING finger domain-containing protein 1-like isoform X2 [Ficedula albicollis]